MKERMDDAAIREAMARAEKATPGPWTFNPLVAVESPSREVIGIDWTTDDTADLNLRDCDGAFIAAARTDVPALAAEALARGEEIAALRAEVARLRAAAIPEDAIERGAKWLVENNADRYGRSWEDTPECQRDDARSTAAEMIAALRRDA